MTPATPAPGICSYLFAYGTLMSAAGGKMGRAQRQRLGREGSLVAPVATIAGRLHDLGDYPGLVESNTPGDVVRGEVWHLSSPDPTWLWLDAYEGIVPGNHSHNEYERLERPVMLTDGTSLSAWVYLYRRPVDPQTFIPGGNWLESLA
ncbi:unnamed protein product [Phaeothamnion confervicola]